MTEKIKDMKQTATPIPRKEHEALQKLTRLEEYCGIAGENGGDNLTSLVPKYLLRLRDIESELSDLNLLVQSGVHDRVLAIRSTL